MIYNLGSINIDHVYQVDGFARPGETISSYAYAMFLGGKGINQSIATLRAGGAVCHIGCINPADAWLRAQLTAFGIDSLAIQTTTTPSGHAIIQIDANAENTIMLFAGANACIDAAAVQHLLQQANSGDWLLCQHETNGIAAAMNAAQSAGLRLAFNPAPFAASVLNLPLEHVELLIVNQIELSQFGGTDSIEDNIQRIQKQYKNIEIIVTLGKQGSIWQTTDTQIFQPAFTVQAIDTTAAGDTFIGYLLSLYHSGATRKQALHTAAKAAALAVTQLGAATSIPALPQVSDSSIQENYDPENNI